MVLVALEEEIVEIRTTRIMATQEVVVAVATTTITEAAVEVRIEDLAGVTEVTADLGPVILLRPDITV